MGNIADALEKAGVDLVDQPAGLNVKDERPVKKSVVETQPKVERAVPQTKPQTKPELVTDVSDWDERVDMVANGSSHASEAFRILRSRILFPQEGATRVRTVMVASSAPSEGKSFVAVNLAVSLAKGVDQHSLLVDCDLRIPSLASLLGLKSVCRRGLSNYLRGECELPELITRTAVEKLSLIASGDIPINPAELLTSGRMSRLVTELSGRYADRFVIFDSPPFQIASEASVLSQNVDGVVLVVGYGKSDRARVKSMVDTIGKEKIIGVVFNSMPDGLVRNKMFDPYGNYSNEYYHPSKND